MQILSDFKHINEIWLCIFNCNYTPCMSNNIICKKKFHLIAELKHFITDT